MGQQESAQQNVANLETALRLEQEKRAKLQAVGDRQREEARAWRRNAQLAAAGGVGLALAIGGVGFFMLRRQCAAAVASMERSLTTRHEAALADARRRAKLDVDKARKFAVDSFARDLLPVADCLTLAIEHASTSVGASTSTSTSVAAAAAPATSALAEGVALTEQSLLSAFGNHGIRRQEARGQLFDPNSHEAVMRVVRAGAAEGEVAEVFRSGFTIHDRVLRAAQVSVVAPQPAKEPPAKDSEEAPPDSAPEAAVPNGAAAAAATQVPAESPESSGKIGVENSSTAAGPESAAGAPGGAASGAQAQASK